VVMTEQKPDEVHNMPQMPQIVLAQRVIDKIVRGALLYPEPETGEALVGLIVPQAGRDEPDVYVLDTIGPGEHTVRQWGMFEQGDDWQGDVFDWLYWNWEAFRDLRRPSYGSALAGKWDIPLSHVGDWHKQPGNMTEPSGGDTRTARQMIADPDTPLKHILAPIVTMYPLTDGTPENAAPDTPVASDAAPAASAPDDDAAPDEQPNTITITQEDAGWIIRIDFWYMSARSKQFVAVQPAVWPDGRLPSLPPIAWHLAYPRRFAQEFGLLRDAGYTVDVVRWDADGQPPYEICFSVYKPGQQHVILLVTSADYPQRQPAPRIAPLVPIDDDEDVFEKLYQASKPVLAHQLPDWDWDSKRTLIELVMHLEKTHKKDEAE
jgi:hypothetical protein